jgi:hypothetical protein
METLELTTYPNIFDPIQELGVAKYVIGDIVTEKFVSPGKAVPMKIKEVVRPKPDKRGRYYNGFSYRFDTVFAEDGDAYVFSTDVPLPEGLLIPFEEVREDVVGTLASKAIEIRDLNLKNPLRKN